MTVTVRFELQRRTHYVIGTPVEEWQWTRESIALAKSITAARKQLRAARREDRREDPFLGEFRIVRVTTIRRVVK